MRNDSIYRRAVAAFESGDSESARRLIDDAIGGAANQEDSLYLREIRAKAYEWGAFREGIDLEKAYLDYIALEEHADLLGSSVLVGAARTLFGISGEKFRLDIQRLCLKAIRHDSNPHAMMIIGLLHEKILGDDVGARKWFLRAFARGLPWGLRFWSNSHRSSGHQLKAWMGHILTTVLSPVLVLIFGARGAFGERPQ